MERHYNNDFERFLRENADQYRMYPSENVWKGVYKSLHSKRRWIAISASFFLLIGGLTAILLINNSRQTSKTGSAISSTNPVQSGTNTAEAAVLQNPADQSSGLSETPTGLQAPAHLSVVRERPLQPVRPRTIRTAAPGSSAPAVINTAGQPDVVNQSERAIPQQQTTASSLVSVTTTAAQKIRSLVKDPAAETEPAVSATTNPVASTKEPDQPGSGLAEPVSDPVVTIEVKEIPATVTVPSGKEELTNTTPLPPSYSPESMLNAELVRNTVSPLAKKKKLAVQLFFAPTISYRKLTENKSFIRDAALQNGGTPNYAYFEGINDAVKHKPDMGLEAGVYLKYPLTPQLSVKAGLQLNVTRYNIRVFNYAGALTTIALNTGNPADALNTYSTYSNIDGYNQDWLQNLYFQASAPVGIEYRFRSNNNVSFGIGGTIQPSHILTERAYLLSTDFKNYAEVPWLIRRWNVNTSLEAFISYNTGKLKWQVGPQVRRQLNSSFVKSYPVNEFPMDYGLKVGIQLNK